MWWALFRWSARLDQPALAARLLKAAIEPLQGPAGGGAKRVLMLAKQGLAEDGRTAFGNDPRFSLHALDAVEIKAFKALASIFLPREVDDYAYVSDDPAIIAAKARYRDFLGRMWQRFQALQRFDAVVTANFTYYAERELAAALEAQGTPFVVLHKENLKSPGRMEFFTEIYRTRRGPFSGRRILVYNDLERRVQRAAEIASDDRITVTGMPRLDNVHAWRRENAGRTREDGVRPNVLFFSFMAKTGLPRIARKAGFADPSKRETIGDERDHLDWAELTAGVHRAAVELARAAPHIDVIVKSKPTPLEVAALNKEIEACGPRPANLSTISGGDPLKLILRADAVFAFNTTAAFEAIAAGKPLVTAAFAEALKADREPYIVDLGGAAIYADSPEDLAMRLRTLAEAARPVPAELAKQELDLLETWTGNPDGNAAKRAADALWAEVGEQGKRP